MIKAAQYVRMSTDQQPLSIGTQKAAIQVYAAANQFEIVATYADEARSGVRLVGRDAMQKLLLDVMDKKCQFTTILVLDVSRWGRFQDTDESAYYEYHCRKNGVNVIYVAESFGASSTPFDAVLKQLKRTMAAEYSRELGVKARAGQIRAVSLGYATGRLPCLGYRRESVSAEGDKGRQLGLHERKPRITDRVRWVLGPEREIEAIRRIFTSYANTKSTVRDIVRTLNAEGVTSHRGERMTQDMLYNLLRSELVRGVFSWGTRTHKPSATNISKMSEPVRNYQMVPPLVDQVTWQRVQAKLQQTAHVYRNGLDQKKMLDQLRRVLKKQPLLGRAEFGQNGLAHVATYRKHFGSLTEAVRLAQRVPAGNDTDRAPCVRVNRRFFLQDLYQGLSNRGVTVEARPLQNLLRISGVDVRPRSAEPRRYRDGLKYWLVRHLRSELLSDKPWLLVMLPNESRIAGRYLLMSPEEQMIFDGHIPWTESDKESLFCVFEPSDLIGRLRERLCNLAQPV